MVFCFLGFFVLFCFVFWVSDKRYGTTPPISLEPPTEEDKRQTEELEAYLRSVNLYETEAGRAKREEVLGIVAEIVRQWSLKAAIAQVAFLDSNYVIYLFICALFPSSVSHTTTLSHRGSQMAPLTSLLPKSSHLGAFDLVSTILAPTLTRFALRLRI